MIKNTNKFRQAAIMFQTYGYYTSAPKNTTGYTHYWDEETRRCLYGWTADDGDFISGYYYFYLNYSPILVVKEKKISIGQNITRTVLDKSRDFASFYDSDYDYFNYIEEAERLGKHAVVIKKRRAGYSFKGASMMCRNFYLIPESKSFAIASEAEFLTKDGLLNKAWDLMSWIDQNTAWIKKRQKIDTKMHKRASYIVDNDGTKIEAGIMSEIMGVTLKNDIQKARGKSGKLILWEEGGKFPGLKDAWQIARPSVEQGTNVFGLMVAYGTGGTEEADYGGLRDLFYETEGYNVLGIDNIWDEGALKQCGFFVPEYVNMEGADEQGRAFMDADGNTLKHIAIPYILGARQKIMDNATDKAAIDRYIAEHPMNPMEATLQLSGNIFPKKDLIKQLAYLRNTDILRDHKQVGELDFDGAGVIKWTQVTNKKSLSKYRLEKSESREGSIVIYEHPTPNAPWGLYIAGCLIPGEQVYTTTGLMKVEDITYSNILIDKDGEAVNIKALLRYEKEDEDIYKIKLSNTFRTTTFTKEHPIYTSNHITTNQNIIDENLLKFDFEKVSDIKVTDWIKYPNIYYNPERRELEWLKKDYWWFIGLWLGDGWCSKNRICIAFDTTNRTQIDRLKAFVLQTFKINTSERNRNGTIEIAFTNKELVDLLTSTYGKGANGKRIPEEIKRLSIDEKGNLLLGYLDSDGCLYTDSRGYHSAEFVSMNLELLEDFHDLAFSIGLIGNLSKLRDAGEYSINGRTGIQNVAYHLRFGHYDTLKFATLCDFNKESKLVKIDQSNIKVTRSRPKSGCFLSKDERYIYFQIKSIEKDKYTGVVYNFETESHTFCTYHIATHNCDPYDHNKSGTDSLGSVFIYKRFMNFEETFDTIVAEYTARPETAEDFYENVRKLLMYYNGTVLYENQNPGLAAYFRNKHSDYLLSDQPNIISKIIKNSTVQRGKGIHMVVAIKDWAEGVLRDWLIEEYEPGKKNLTKILSEPLLEELIAYNDKGNFDRVMAMFCVMLFKEELHNLHVKKKENIEKRSSIFESPIFTNQEFEYFN